MAYIIGSRSGATTFSGDITMGAGTRILFDNLEGSAALPAIAWADAGGVYDTGIYQNATDELDFTMAGVVQFNMNAASFVIQQGNNLAFDTATGVGDAFIEIDAANIIAQRNSTNAQEFRIYGTFTDSSNGEWLRLGHDGSTGIIDVQANGTGGFGNLNIRVNNGTRWIFNTNAHFIASTDNSSDIGINQSNRPRTGYFGTSVNVPSADLINNTEGGTAKWTPKSSHDSVTLTGATTDTTTISVPSGARLIAVLLNVDTTVVNDGDDTWAAAFITGSTTTVAAAGTAAAQNTKITLMLPDEITTAITQIRFTPQGADFTAGVIEVVVYYEELTPMADA